MSLFKSLMAVVVLIAVVAILCVPVARACDYGAEVGGAFSIMQQPVYAQQFVAPVQQQVVYQQPIVQRQVVAYSAPIVQRQFVQSYSAPIIQRQRVRERVVVPRGRAGVNVRVGGY